jgi:uncharacterized protein YigE (DUF2233 family)
VSSCTWKSALLVVVLGACDRSSKPVPRRLPSSDVSLSVVIDSSAPAPDGSHTVERPTDIITPTVITLSPWYDTHLGVQWRESTVRFSAISGSAQWPGMVTGRLHWTVTRIDLSRIKLTVERAPSDSIAALMATDSGALAAVNGGFFEPGFAPSGLVWSNATLVRDVTTRGGSGILQIRDGIAEIISSATHDAGMPMFGEVELGLQCGPRLIETGGRVGIYRDDRQFAARTAVCLRNNGRTLDLIATWNLHEPLRGPGLYYFSRMLAAPSPVGDPAGCDTALNLDGGPSTATFARLPGQKVRHPGHWLHVRGDCW